MCGHIEFGNMSFQLRTIHPIPIPNPHNRESIGGTAAPSPSKKGRPPEAPNSTESRWPLLLGTMALLLTMCSLLAISISMQTAYMWLALVLITLLFLTTFTCTKQAPLLLIQDSTSETPNSSNDNTSFTEVHHRNHRQISQVEPYWVNDLPPPYYISVTIEETAPPPYLAAISHFGLPPPYHLSAEQEAKERPQEAIQVTNNSTLQIVQKTLASASVTTQLSPEQGLPALTLAAT